MTVPVCLRARHAGRAREVDERNIRFTQFQIGSEVSGHIPQAKSADASAGTREQLGGKTDGLVRRRRVNRKAMDAIRELVARDPLLRHLHVQIRCGQDQVVDLEFFPRFYPRGAHRHAQFAQRGDGDIAMFLNHIDYVAKKFGPDHVALGTDVAYSSQNMAAERKKASSSKRPARKKPPVKKAAAAKKKAPAEVEAEAEEAKAEAEGAKAKEAKAEEPKAEAVEEPKAETAEEPEASTAEEPESGTSEEPEASVTKKPKASKEEPASGTTEEPATSEEPAKPTTKTSKEQS